VDSAGICGIRIGLHSLCRQRRGEPGEVLEFDSNTGAYLGVFSPGGGGTNGVGAARQPLFGPDGNFYVVDALNGDIRRFTPNEDPLGVFATGDLPVPAVGARSDRTETCMFPTRAMARLSNLTGPRER
jgi:hypothetical protein